MGRYAGLGFLLAAVAVLAGCGGISPSGRNPVDMDQCGIDSGLYSRLDAARANGVTGRIDATPEELAYINACARGDTVQVPRSAPASSAPANTVSTDTATAYATQCMFEVQVPASGGRQAGIDAMNACISRKAAAAGDAPATPTVLPSVAGVPQTVTTRNTGTIVTETYTYGTPPAAAIPASAPAPAPICNLQMTGGTGYTCRVR